jgi:putative membrane protein
MAFVDFLAFQQVTLLFAAVLVAYIGATVLLAMRKNDKAGVTSALRGGAVPLGALGFVATSLGLWGEVAWPLPGSYNILFTDIYLLFGATLLVLAISMAFSLKLQYAGLFALVAGGLSGVYGWTGYGLGMTKDPLETFLLYAAFGLAGLLAFPATLMVDHYLEHPESSLYTTGVAVPRARPNLSGASRAVQPVFPTGAGAPTTETESWPTVVARFRLPVAFYVTLITFVVAMGIAGFAALAYLHSTLPAHLTSAP